MFVHFMVTMSQCKQLGIFFYFYLPLLPWLSGCYNWTALKDCCLQGWGVMFILKVGQLEF